MLNDRIIFVFFLSHMPFAAVFLPCAFQTNMASSERDSVRSTEGVNCRLQVAGFQRRSSLRISLQQRWRSNGAAFLHDFDLETIPLLDLCTYQGKILSGEVLGSEG